MQLLHRTPDCAQLLLRWSEPSMARVLCDALAAAAVSPAVFAVGNTTGTYALDLGSHGGRTVAAHLLEANRLMRKRLSLCWCGPSCMHACHAYTHRVCSCHRLHGVPGRT